MKRTFLAVLAAFMILTLTGCGSHNDSTPVFVTSILSDLTFDGDIQRDLITGDLSVIQGNTLSVRAGLDPALPFEYRAFLDFPLAGANGVPGDAIIESAFLDIVINDIDIQFPADTITMRIDLVSFQPPALFPSDFDRLELPNATVRPLIFLSDIGRQVTIDVTPLMVEAQRLGLVDFQVRIMEDLGNVPPGFIDINETSFAPLLTVTYF